ncbi:TIGR04283 family arsenosugar biosynthesis glycosyltransferase [Ghiorsea bivora]|uniref:TIGR04283 family arsenosugar biosynthesis glycosyltransferase n=1 Tax=Ghiorsea bivora TaxID=1485545 RepID=UPI0022B7642D|nr:TIGR04283 family arsenosugar biosynthesis glycosyltransferase [Ghiorsea bivora]
MIPVYNEEETLPHALREIQKLNLEATDQLIFIDGGSNDHTKQLIQDAGFHCLVSQAGRAKQMNMGAQNTKSDIILFLHIDTSISSSNISNIKKTYNQGYLSGRFNIRLSSSGLSYQIISFFMNARSCLSKISTGDQAMFVRRDVFETVGGFPDLPLMEDIALSKKLRPLGHIACLKDTLVTSSRRWEKYGVINTVLLMWKLRFLYWIGISPEKLAKMYRHIR